MKEIINSHFFEANTTHIKDILEAMERLRKEFPTHFFVPSTEEELQHIIVNKHGFVLLIEIKGQLAGGVIVMYPNENNHYLSNHDYAECAVVDSIFLEPQFRGQSIAQYLMKAALERLDKIPYIYASVAIDNIPSQKLFQRNGFKIYEQKKLYNNYDRYVFLLEKDNQHAL